MYFLIQFGLEDERVHALVERLLHWRWPDGGWNCDKDPAAATSTFIHTIHSLRGLALYAQRFGDETARDAARTAAEVLLTRSLFRRRSNGEVIKHAFIELHYLRYWHYDILLALEVMAEIGELADPRCNEALDLLERKELAGGGWPAESTYYRVSSDIALNADFVGLGRRRPQAPRPLGHDGRPLGAAPGRSPATVTLFVGPTVPHRASARPYSARTCERVCPDDPPRTACDRPSRAMNPFFSALRTDKLTWLSRALSLVGLGISVYLAYTYLRHQIPVCDGSNGCGKVAQSDYARPGGIPMPLFGVAGYLLLFVTACMRGDRAREAGMVLTVIAIAASGVLTYLELQVIHAVCYWCVASAICASCHVVVNSARYVRGEPKVTSGARKPIAVHA